MEYTKESVLVKASDLERSQKLEAVQVAKEAWRARFPEQPGEGSNWLIGPFPQDELIKLLATIGALTLNALPNVGRRSNAGAIASAVGLDMRTGGGPSPGAGRVTCPRRMSSRHGRKPGLTVPEVGWRR